MKLFKSIDDRFREIGFIKVEEDKYGAEYERKIKSMVIPKRFIWAIKRVENILFNHMIRI